MSVAAAARGFCVFTGHKSEIFKLALSSHDPGILFYNSPDASVESKDSYFGKFRAKGFAVVAQNEEPGITSSDFSKFVGSESSVYNSPSLDYLFCWGQDEYSFTRRLYPEDHPDSDVNVAITGSPRTSLWGPLGRRYYRAEIEKIRNKYHGFVLFATNFGSGNYFLSERASEKVQSAYPRWGAEGEGEYHATVSRDSRLMQQFVNAAIEVAQKTDLMVVIRPHPIENVSRWEELVDGVDNIVVCNEGELTPWILSAEVVIQNGCTSALEAIIAGVPVISFAESAEDLAHDGLHDLPNKLAINASSVDQLLGIISRLVEGGLDNRREDLVDSRQTLLSRKVFAAGTKQPVVDIVQIMEQMTNGTESSNFKNLGSNSFLDQLRGMYKRSWVHRLSIQGKMDHVKRQPIHLDDVVRHIENARMALDEPSDIEASQVAPNSYRISMKQR